MPRRKQYLQRKSGGEITAAQREMLLTGLDFSCLSEGFADDDHMEAMWESHWSGLLDDWMNIKSASDPHGEFGKPRPGGPGSRPWAWWHFEAPEPRLQVAGKGQSIEGCPMSFGMPTQWRWFDPDDPPRFESESDFLARTGMLGVLETPKPLAAHWSSQPGGLVFDYSRKVVDRAIPMGHRVTSACQRQLDDWREAHGRGFYWSDHKARHLHRWMDFFRCSVGDWDGELLRLQDHQAFAFLTPMAWRCLEDDTRRFRRLFIFVSRKWGKSTLSGAFGNYCLVADGEAGAQVYSVALDKAQASIIFKEAVAFAESQPHLEAVLDIKADQIEFGRGLFAPLTKGAKNKLGFNPSVGIVDEYLAFTSDAAVAVIQTGMGSRSNCLLSFISTAGDNAEGPCFAEYEYACQVVDGAVASDSYFAYLAEIDIPSEQEGGKRLGTEKVVEYLLDHPEVWHQAIPGLGVTPKTRFVREQLETARDRPDLAPEILRLNFNRWVFGTTTAWWPYAKWQACADDRGEMALRKALIGKRCYGALDLASISDLAAFGLYFPDTHHFLVWFWCPQEGVEERADKDRVPYDRWARDGWIEPTPGATVDFDLIRERVVELSSQYRILQIGYDKWNALQIVHQLGREGLTMVEVGRSWPALSPPSKHLEKMVLDGSFRHGANPCLSWQASHVEIEESRGDIRPVRPKEAGRRKKVDGIVTAVMCISFDVRGDGERRRSVYEERGIRSV